MTDLSAYMKRIGYGGPHEPTLAVLRELHINHTRAIAFENLASYTGMPVELDVDWLMDKFTRRGRGGYCYEQNLLFRHVLEALGFKVTGLAARVRMAAPEDAITRLSHMLLRVDVDGEPFIADTGFGGQTLTAPVRLAPGLAQQTPHGPYRLLRGDGVFRLQAGVNGGWLDLYDFDLTPYHRPDYDVFNWYTSTHPSSLFVNDLVAARPTPAGRHTLHNRDYSFYGLDGAIEKRELNSIREIRDLLENRFHVAVSGIPGLDARLEAMLAQ